ncbi:hypothetical protein GJAV_G00012410 [Gymnothorax javanicus]|nr:hypothetical protein GJAV_G00012410 [Gymnothorax javanicus]
MAATDTNLEARERQAEAQSAEEVKVTRTLEEEIARLREEGSRQLQEEQRLIKEQIQKEREGGLHSVNTTAQSGNGAQSNSNLTPKLKLKWKSLKEDETNGGYSEDILLRLLQKYGDVLNVLISKKKRGSAVAEFATVKAAELACKNEMGLKENPLRISWLEGQPVAPTPVSRSHGIDGHFRPMQNTRHLSSALQPRIIEPQDEDALLASSVYSGRWNSDTASRVEGNELAHFLPSFSFNLQRCSCGRGVGYTERGLIYRRARGFLCGVRAVLAAVC